MTRPIEPVDPPDARLRRLLPELADAIVDLVHQTAAPDTFGPDRLVTVDQASQALGVARTTVYELIRTGDLRSLKVRGRRLVPESALRALIEDGQP